MSGEHKPGTEPKGLTGEFLSGIAEQNPNGNTEKSDSCLVHTYDGHPKPETVIVHSTHDAV